MDRSKNLKRILHNISAKTKKGTICIYYSNAGLVRRFSTGVRLDKDKWDKKNSKPKRGALDSYDEPIVDSLYNKISKLISDYQYEHHQLPPVQHIESHLNRQEDSSDIHQLFQDYIGAKKKRVTESTIEYYQYVALALKEADKALKYKLTLQNFNYDFIEKFIDHCLLKGNSPNTVNLRIDVFKAFVKYLNKRKIKHNAGIEDWEKLNSIKSDMLCLERNELNDILDYVPKNATEQRTKDIIVFLSHTGMRKADAEVISKESIVDGCLVFRPGKTEKKTIQCKVPISKPVAEILERNNYKIPIYCESRLSEYIHNFLAELPTPSLKELVNYRGELKEKFNALSSHSVGRKTFINLCVQEGVPIPIIMGFTGHTEINTVLKHYLDKHMNNLPQLSKVFQF